MAGICTRPHTVALGEKCDNQYLPCAEGVCSPGDPAGTCVVVVELGGACGADTVHVCGDAESNGADVMLHCDLAQHICSLPGVNGAPCMMDTDCQASCSRVDAGVGGHCE